MGDRIMASIFLLLSFVGIIILAYKCVNGIRKASESKEIRNVQNFVNSKVTKAKKFTERSISKSYLTGCSWLLTNDNSSNKIFTFRANGELLIITDGIVSKASYELIIDNNSILITENDITELYNILNIENNFLFLNRVANKSILVFANQTKFKDTLKIEIIEKAKSLYSFDNI